MQELPELLGNLFCYDEQTFLKNSSYKICWYVPYFPVFRLKTEEKFLNFQKYFGQNMKVYNGGTGTMSEICSKLITKPIFTWPSTISSNEQGI